MRRLTLISSDAQLRPLATAAPVRLDDDLNVLTERHEEAHEPFHRELPDFARTDEAPPEPELERPDEQTDKRSRQHLTGPMAERSGRLPVEPRRGEQTRLGSGYRVEDRWRCVHSNASVRTTEW